MSYKIAVASSDGKTVDLHFGAASSFLIYAVSDDASFSLAETRAAPEADSDVTGTGAGCTPGQGAGCASGGCGAGCGNGGGQSAKAEALSDCRCVVAQKIGFNVQKQLEKKAIVSFDVDCSVQEALEKISAYFHKIDNHVSLAKRQEA